MVIPGLNILFQSSEQAQARFCESKTVFIDRSHQESCDRCHSKLRSLCRAADFLAPPLARGLFVSCHRTRSNPRSNHLVLSKKVLVPLALPLDMLSYLSLTETRTTTASTVPRPALASLPIPQSSHNPGAPHPQRRQLTPLIVYERPFA